MKATRYQVVITNGTRRTEHVDFIARKSERGLRDFVLGNESLIPIVDRFGEWSSVEIRGQKFNGRAAIKFDNGAYITFSGETEKTVKSMDGVE